MNKEIDINSILCRIFPKVRKCILNYILYVTIIKSNLNVTRFYA